MASVGCDSQNTVVCTLPVPAFDTSCPDDRQCTLAAGGEAACLAPGVLGEGDTCQWDLAERREAPCGPGLACVQSFGHWRCLRLCTTEGSDQCLGGDLPSWGCRATLVDKPDLGVCLPKCTLGGSDCPNGTSCTVPFGVGLAVCAPPGSADESAPGEGESCGTTQPCLAGLVCTPSGSGAHCRRPRGDGCGPDHYVYCLTGTPEQGEPTDEDYSVPHPVCVPCQPTGTQSIDGRPLAVCHSETACTDDGGTLARLEGSPSLTPLRVAGVLERIFRGGDDASTGLCVEQVESGSGLEVQGRRFREEGVKVSATQTDGVWVWSDLDEEGGPCAEIPVSDSAFGPDAPQSGECLVLTARGVLEAKASENCDVPVLCAVGQADCRER